MQFRFTTRAERLQYATEHKDEIVGEWIDRLLADDEEECRIPLRLRRTYAEGEFFCIMGVLGDVLVQHNLAYWDEDILVESFGRRDSIEEMWASRTGISKLMFEALGLSQRFQYELLNGNDDSVPWRDLVGRIKEEAGR